MPPTQPISSTKPPSRHEDALAVLKRLRSSGHVAYFAGGCVRDLLMGKEPKDWDVATDAPPERVQRIFINTQAVGAAFGVILVRMGISTIEVATFRAEGTYTDGRRPDSVRFTTAGEDAKRRDFTINGLFLDPEASDSESAAPSPTGPVIFPFPPHGVIIDYVGGLADLRAGVLRAIGDPLARFAEDHLRLLRAVRFAARFGFSIEPETARAIRVNAIKLRGISPERIADELRLMLTAPTRGGAWRMIWEFGLIDVIMRFVSGKAGGDAIGAIGNEASPFETDRSLFLKIAPGEPISIGLALAAAVLDYRLQGAGEKADSLETMESQCMAMTSRGQITQMGRAMREALRISNEELDEMVGVLEPLEVLLDVSTPGIAAQKRFLSRATARATRELLAGLSRLQLFLDPIVGLSRELEKLEASGVDLAPKPLLTGDDLTAMEMKPGPRFKIILDQVYDAQLEGKIVTREEAEGMARGLA